MITNLTSHSVSILEARDGANWRVAYANSAAGRRQLQADYPGDYAGIIAAWGDQPTVEDIDIPIPVAPPITLEQRVETCETDIDQIVTGLEALSSGS